ncbi:MAG: YceI family protein [Bacteroidetes bacterium]|nr:YceI family protein [Bacteroidota bacterium]
MKPVIFIALLFISTSVVGQKYISEKSNIVFFSSALLEDIEARNEKAKSVFNADNGDIVFSIPVNQFQFAKSLMQEHFNEKYMESDKYPKTIFKGKVLDFEKGSENNNVWTEGELEIHGVKRNVKIQGNLIFKGEKVIIESKFIVKLEDYEIEIPKLLFQKIAEEVEVTVNFEYKRYEK